MVTLMVTLMQTLMQIDLSALPTVVNKSFYPLLWDTHRFLVLMGGAGSGKSVFAAQKLVVRMVKERGHRIVVMRKVARSNRLSTWANIRTVIADWGWEKYFDVNKTDMSIRFIPNNSHAFLLGLDDPEKLKSIDRPTSVWLEEATEFNEGDLEQVNLRLRGVWRYYKQIMLTFNPISMMHWLKKRFFDVVAKNVRTHHSNYINNQFLDDEYKEELEALRGRNKHLWKIYARGLWGLLKGLIYEPWEFYPGAWPKEFHDVFWGLDFGFNNPCACIEFGKRDNEHFATERIYESGLTTPDLMARMEQTGVQKKGPIYGDGAEPDRIEEMRRKGWNIKPARKGQGSVHAGIAFVKGLKIWSKAENVNLTKELHTYTWGEDKDGTLTEEPVKFMDHLMDAARYALHTHGRRYKPQVFDRTRLGI